VTNSTSVKESSTPERNSEELRSGSLMRPSVAALFRKAMTPSGSIGISFCGMLSSARHLNGLLYGDMCRPVAVECANDRVVEQVANNLGSFGCRMSVIATHQLGPGLAPSGDCAFTAHCRVHIKKCAAGFSGYRTLVAYKPRDCRSGDDAAAFAAVAAVHRRYQHYGSMRKRCSDSSDDFHGVPLILIHRQPVELALVRPVVEYHQIGIAMGELL